MKLFLETGCEVFLDDSYDATIRQLISASHGDILGARQLAFSARSRCPYLGRRWSHWDKTLRLLKDISPIVQYMEAQDE